MAKGTLPPRIQKMTAAPAKPAGKKKKPAKKLGKKAMPGY